MMLEFDQAMSRVRAGLARKSLGFVATAATPWHALGVDAWIDRLRESGETRGGVVLMMAHPTNGLLLSAADFPACQAAGNIEFLPVAQRLPSSLVGVTGRLLELAARAALVSLTRRRPASRLPFRIASPRLPDAFTLLHLPTSIPRESPVEFVVLDEGLSSYLPAPVAGQVRRPDRQAAGAQVARRELELFLRRGYDRLHGKFLLGRFRSTTRLLFDAQPDGSLRANPILAAEYRRAAARLADRATDLPTRRGPRAMILPQPWSEIGQTNEEIERALYAEVAASLRPQGYQVVIKPHPRERPGKYATLTAAAGIEVWTQPVPVETLFADLRSGDLVLGHNTTSLLTAAALSPATPRTLGDLLIDRAGAGEIFANFQRHFRRLAGHTVSDGRDLLRRQAA